MDPRRSGESAHKTVGQVRGGVRGSGAATTAVEALQAHRRRVRRGRVPVVRAQDLPAGAGLRRGAPGGGGRDPDGDSADGTFLFIGSVWAIR